MSGICDANKIFWDMIGPEPELPPAHREISCDVIVCGGGLAGVAALRSAVEAGAKTVLFEKCKAVQGRSGAFGVIGFRNSNRFGRGIEAMRRKVAAEIIKEGGNRGDYRIVRRWAEHSADDLEWYIAPMGDVYILERTTDVPPEGVKYWLQSNRDPMPAHLNPEEDYYPSYPGVWQFRPGGHMPVLKKNFEVAMESGLAEAFFNTPVQKLIKEDGRIVGVIARSDEGEVILARASRGVILATGGYSGDETMMNYYAPQARCNPRIYGSRDSSGKQADTGDGHRMGVWAGGVLEDPPHAIVSHNMGGAMGISPFLQLDAYGRRFMNEDVGGMQVEYKVERLPHQFSWQFFDSTWPDCLPYCSIVHGGVCAVYDKQAQRDGKINPTINKMDGYTSLEDVEKEVQAGRLVKADTLEELVELTGLPKEIALSSIARYNELCRKGDDEDFGKAAGRMFPVMTAPFYACKITPAPLLATVSGLMSDCEAHVLGADGLPIPGLYAAGNVQGNRFGGEDPSMFPGTSHGMALTYGRIAGANAAMGK